MNNPTTQDLAKALRITPSAVHQRAKARGLRPERIISRVAFWPPDALRVLDEYVRPGPKPDRKRRGTRSRRKASRGA
jgi:hypothetical protein